MDIKPPRLKLGDEIAIIAPAGPVTPSEIEPAIDLLIKNGYSVVQAPNLYRKQGYLAGNDAARLDDLHSMFENKNTKAILCARGGYGTLRLLDRIDYDLIKRNPKIIVGYSDITGLLLAIHKKTGLVTFHGPVARELTKNRHKNLTAFFDLVSSQGTLELDLSSGTTLAPGRARGNILGGNLSLISNLLGAPFMPSMKGAILFIEEKGEPLYRIDRMLTHLRLGGIFDDLAALIAGEFVDCGDISKINRLLTDVTSDGNVPVLSGLPVGHGMENITIPLGLQADLDTENMTLSILDRCVVM
ncbi:LD-carboxypeptidase [Thermodesulfobacteriota bacterium]